MKKLLATATCTGLMLLGLHAFADDMTKPTDTSKQAHAQMMKDCMAKEQAKKDGSTKDQMMQACKDQLKAQGMMPKDEHNY